MENICNRVASKSHQSYHIEEIKNQLRQQGIYIVFEDGINWDENSDSADNELEKALESGSRIIIIEPRDLGEMASVWIVFGKFLNKLTITAGLATMATAYYWPKWPHLYCGIGAFNFLCTSLYGFAWQFDPCTKYRIEKDLVKRANLPLHLVSAKCPTVLVKECTCLNSFCRILVSFSAVGVCAWNIYKMYKKGSFTSGQLTC